MKDSVPDYLVQAAKEWVILLNKLSYAGFRKEKIRRELDEEFGEGNWLATHFYDGSVISTRQACLIYEEAYYEFLKSNPGVRAWIVNAASEVYDTEPSNISSGMDYSIQESAATHLQDIAVRRALTRLKLEEQDSDFDLRALPHIRVFEGDHLVRIRGHTTEGYRLNPGKVPFHRPEKILDADQKGWWDDGSVEDFYQKNKVLLVNPENFIVKLAMVCPAALFFEHAESDYYKAAYSGRELSSMLRRVRGKDTRRLYYRKGGDTFTEVKNSPAKPYSAWMMIVPGLLLPRGGCGCRVDFGELKSSN